ncbi:MAG: TetR/AcrR family transcriptional regulator [Bacteroidota bacterium]
MIAISPRTPKENERVREERRGEILEAAIKVFTRKGYAATKIADIAAAAKISHGLIYHYFRSKEEVYAALADRLVQGPEAMGSLVDRPGAPREKIRLMLEMMLGSVRARPEYYVLAVQAMTTEGVAPAVAEKVFRGGLESAQAMAQIIAEGQAAGEFRPGDPRQHFNLLYAVINGLAIAQTFSRHTHSVMVDVDAETIMRLIEEP